MKRYAPILAIGGLYCLLRLLFIGTLSPFTDESLYIRWGQLMIYRESLRFASIEYLSRQPLGLWLFGIGSLAFQHPVFGPRIVVLVSSLPVLIVTWLVSKRLFGLRSALLATFFLAVSPLFIHVQSLALLDGFLLSLSSIALAIIILSPRPRGFLLGMVVGISLWIKSTAIFFLIPILLTLARYGNQLLIFVFTVLIVLIPLLLQPHIQNVLMEGQSFIITSPAHLLSTWLTNIKNIGLSLLIYFPALVFSLRQRQTRLWVWVLIPMGIVTISSTNPLARYYVIGALPLAILAGEGFRQLTHKLPSGIIAIVLVVFLVYGTMFSTNPRIIFSIFPSQYSERNYAFGWTSGIRMNDIIVEIENLKRVYSRVVVVVSDTPGNPADYIAAHYFFDPSVVIHFSSFHDPNHLERIHSVSEATPIFLIARASEPPSDPTVKLEIHLQLPIDNDDSLLIYRVRSQ